MNKCQIINLWEECLPVIKNRIGETVFETWIAPLTANEDLSQKLQKLVLEAPDSFFRDWILRNYLTSIKDTLKSQNAQLSFDIEIQIKKDKHTEKKEDTKVKIKEIQPQAILEKLENVFLNPRFTFQDFVVGPCNRFAHAASLAIAESPAKAYNPFFIYGGSGLGKTHLIQAICHCIKKRVASVKICYIPSENFTNELIDAIQHHSTAAFRKKYRSMDILVIDDIHFIAGKEATQEEFFNTFNSLYDAHKQIIITSDRPPREILKLEERLVSRFSWGLVTDIQIPDLETRIAILKKKIEKEPINIPDEVIFFIANIVKTNIRELEGALIRVIACSLLGEKPITIDLAKETLNDLIQHTQKPVNLNKIQELVANEFEISLAEIKTKQRNRNIVLPRQIAMYLSRQLTEFSLPEIAKFFGGRDHTTVLYAYNKIKLCIDNDEKLKQRVQKIIENIKK